jgi:hypothetical protein
MSPIEFAIDQNLFRFDLGGVGTSVEGRMQ